MQLNEKELRNLLITAGTKDITKLLDLIPLDSGISYTDLKNQFNQTIGIDRSSSGFYYYLKRLVRNNILRKDEIYKTYYLTRLGVQLVTLVNNFKELCMEYDISDCDADGRVILKVVGRKI